MTRKCIKCGNHFPWPAGEYQAPAAFWLSHGCGDKATTAVTLTSGTVAAIREVGMTRLEKAVRSLSKWDARYEEIFEALDELDRERAAGKINGVPLPAGVYDAKPSVDGKSMIVTPALTDAQRRMGLRSARFVNGPEWNSDVD